MIFAAPWVLLALPALPLLWWLLRVTPPAPRSESFPAIRLLMGLHAREETPARTPWWLLLLRMIAATLVILALARPVLDAGSTLAGSGPVLLVVDNGWASAGDWPRRMQAANTVLDRAERAGRQVALLATAPDGAGAAPQVTAPLPVADLRARVAALHPEPWPPDRAAAATALLRLAPARRGGGLSRRRADPWRRFRAVRRGAGRGGSGDRTARSRRRRPGCCCRRGTRPTGWSRGSPRRRSRWPARRWCWRRAATAAPWRARRWICRPVRAKATAAMVLPPELRNRLSRLVLEGPPSAASVVLLDERWRRRPVGVLAGDLATADTPFAGPLYYLRRALSPFTEVREADLATLLQREVSVLILADRPLPAGAERDALTRWVEQGGLLIRFAGPRTAEQPIGETDPLMPVKLLGGDRQLGGALSWAEPAGVAQFTASSPFAGLTVPDEVKVNRQVLAEPSADLTGHTWAALADGTPLVTQATRGAGRVVLFHVTANADWSNLPLSGLFVDMLRRLVALSAGVAPISDNSVLAPAETLDGFGLLSAPPQAATGLPANEIARTAASPRHPPGLYGPENGRRALNLGANLPAPEAAPPVPGARIEDYATAVPERALGPALLAVRGGAAGARPADRARSARAAAAEPGRGRRCCSGCWPRRRRRRSRATPIRRWPRGSATSSPATASWTRCRAPGWRGCRNTSTAAPPRRWWNPTRSSPARPISASIRCSTGRSAPMRSRFRSEQAAALNDYMSRGGIILIDTRDSGSGAGFAPGTGSALQRVAQGLVIPPLAPLTTEHVLARAFYLLQDFPGRYTGESVWVQRDQDRANDSVSPVIIGGNDWASAWAVDDGGRNPYAVIPGGARQRTVAYRFGVNLVMYALTGNYKGDQVHVPAILQRLGQ